MAEPRKPILLRISPALWEELARWAGDDLRSINGQIEYILREAVRKRTGKPADENTGSSTPSEREDPPPAQDQ